MLNLKCHQQIQFYCFAIIFYLYNIISLSIYFISRTAFDIKEMINFSNPPPADPKPDSNANNHHRQWPPQSTMPPPQIQQEQNWHWPSMHLLQQFQFQHDYGQLAPMRYYPPPSIPTWQHQYHPQQPNQYVVVQPNELLNHPQQQSESNKDMRRLLDIQLEYTNELKKKSTDLEVQKNNLESQLKELSAKLEASENKEKETNMKLEKKTAEFEELLARIENEKVQKKTNQLEQIQSIWGGCPLTLSSSELDPVADELAQLKNELDSKNKLIKKMEAEMEKANEELTKLMDAQNGNKELAKKEESLENWEDKIKAMEKKFTEKREFAIGQCRSEMEARITELESHLAEKNNALESKVEEITELNGLIDQIFKDLDDSKSSQKHLPQNWESREEKLLEEICRERNKLKTQANRFERLNLELEAKNLQIAQMDKELAAKNEEMEKMKEGHKIAMENSLDEYKSELAQKDEKIQKLEEEIEKDGNVDKIAKILCGNEKEEMKDRESKALANAKKFELKWTEAKEEIAKLQNKLAKMEAEMEENKKEKEQQSVKKAGGGKGRGKRQPQKQYDNGNESDPDYVPSAPGAKKKRVAAQKNANLNHPIVNSISDCLPSTSSNLPSSKKIADDKYTVESTSYYLAAKEK